MLIKKITTFVFFLRVAEKLGDFLWVGRAEIGFDLVEGRRLVFGSVTADVGYTLTYCTVLFTVMWIRSIKFDAYGSGPRSLKSPN